MFDGLRPFLDGFRRVTSSGSFLPEIDGLRFFAVLSVYIYHLAGDVLKHTSPQAGLPSGFVYEVTQKLDFGVPLFFVISGFILGLPFASHHLLGARDVPIGRYLWRRATRLEPPYIVSMLLFYLLKIIGGKGTAWGLFPHLAASLAYVHSLVFGKPSEISIVAWSLEVEIQFYLLAPLIARVFLIKSALRRRFMIAVAGLGAALLQHSNPGAALISGSILGYAQYFLAGFLLVDLYLTAGRPKYSLAWDGLAATVVLTTGFLLGLNSVVTPFLAPGLIGVFYYCAFHSILLRWFVSHPVVSTIGGMCYSIYLLHNYGISVLGRFTELLLSDSSFTLRLALQFLVMTPIVLAVAAMFFRLIEKPCMRPDWPRRLVGGLVGAFGGGRTRIAGAPEV